MKVSKNTVYSYVSFLEESFFLYLVYKHNFSLRKKDLSLPKVYLSNLGFAKRGETNKDLGKKMENAVFLELERRKSAQGSLSYWKNVQQEEVDFVVKNGADIECLIQVCADLNADTKKREWRALLKAARELKAKKLLCITENYASVEKVKGKKDSLHSSFRLAAREVRIFLFFWCILYNPIPEALFLFL